MTHRVDGLDAATPVSLARTATFRLGAMEVRPATREVFREQAREVLEPRVMEVLVALAEANGAVVGRDELIARCWDGRIVSEDAINRVISRLRRTAEGVGGGSWTVETITKVGYRIAETGVATAPAGAPPPAGPAKPTTRGVRIGRRTVILLAGSGAAAAALGAL